jgi:hypothetical protein
MTVDWKRRLIWNLSIAGMISCVALATARLVQLFVPEWSIALMFLASLLAAFEASYSYRVIQERPELQAEAWKSRMAELLLLFFLIKAASYIGDSMVVVLDDIAAWPGDISRLFDGETVSVYMVALLSWLAATRTAHDLERLHEPSNLHPGQPLAAETLSRRFFVGGVVLFMVSGVAHIGLQALLDWQRAPAGGIVFNVLVYFGLGAFMLGQIRLATLSRSWRNQKVQIASGFVGRWVRYSLVLLFVAGLVAVLLPTRYATHFLDAVAGLVNIVFVIISAVYMVVSLLFMLPAWLLSRLLGRSNAPPPMPAPMPSPDISVRPQPQGLSWWESVRTFVFWILAAGILAYAAWHYVRSHPGLWRALATFAPWQWLRRLWQAWQRRLDQWTADRRRRKMDGEVGVRLTREVKAGGRSWLGARSARERVLYQYYRVLQRAKRRGLPRRVSETPSEYEHSVARSLPETEAEMASLTDAFVEARFSEHAVGSETVRHTRDWARAIKRALSTLGRGTARNR